MLISRLNRARAITVYGNPGPGHSQQEALKRLKELGKVFPRYFLSHRQLTKLSRVL